MVYNLVIDNVENDSISKIDQKIRFIVSEMGKLGILKEIFELLVHKRKFHMFPIIVLLIALVGVTALSTERLSGIYLSDLKWNFHLQDLKHLPVTAGFSFWFVIITIGFGIFSFESLAIFVAITVTITQIFAVKLSKGLDIFAIINTKIFLGILFIFVISLYGIFFKILRIDLLRLKKQSSSYWLDLDDIKQSTVFKQY